jgi:hypothetical protein
MRSLGVDVSGTVHLVETRGAELIAGASAA